MKKLNHAVAVMAGVFALTGFNAANAISAIPEADTVFNGGKVYTVNDAQPWAEAVAVKDGKIIYVGDATGAKAYIGKDTEIIETKGKIILSAHVEICESESQSISNKF